MTDDLIQEGRLAVYRALPALLSRASVASDHLAALTYTCQRRAMVDWIRKCVQADRHHEANEPPSQTECWRALILVLFTRSTIERDCLLAMLAAGGVVRKAARLLGFRAHLSVYRRLWAIRDRVPPTLRDLLLSPTGVVTLLAMIQRGPDAPIPTMDTAAREPLPDAARGVRAGSESSVSSRTPGTLEADKSAPDISCAAVRIQEAKRQPQLDGGEAGVPGKSQS
jgi:hypothetical protein